MSRADEIRTRQASIRVDLDALEAKPETNEEDHVRADALLDEWDTLNEELKPLAEREVRVASIRQANEEQRNREATNPTPIRTPDLIVKNHTDPYSDLESIRNGLTLPNEVRSRALFAVEQYTQRKDKWQLSQDGAENVSTLIEKGGETFGTAVSRQILSTGSPEYLASFNAYLNDPAGYRERAAMSLTSANGGYLVPFTLDPTIVLTNAGSANPYRQVASVKTTTTNNWNGVTSAGVSAEWTAEGTEAADASPTVGTLQITPVKADAYLFGSFEVLSDSDFAAQLPELLADAKDRIEETGFAIGTGATQPNGIIPRGTSQNRAGTAATGPQATDVYSLMAALPARFRGPRANNVWVANLTTINTLRNVAAFSGAFSSIVNDNGAGGPTMLGKPFLESTSVLGTFTTGNKVLAFLDAKQFYIVDRIGMSIVYDPIVLGANRRATGQGAWYAFWRVGSDVSTTTAVRVFATLT
jgi:HK97 family phage major capsid protein